MPDTPAATETPSATEGAPVEGSSTAEAQATDTETPSGETPPWGDDFDAERAWKTIQSLREVEKAYKADKAAREKAEQEKADAEKTEIERLTARAEQAEKALAERAREALVVKIADEHSLPADLREFLTGADEAALKAQAERLAASVKAAPAPPAGTRPKPALTPGQGGEPGPDFDPKAIAERIRRSS